MELNQYPDAIADIRSAVVVLDQQINTVKARLQRQLEDSADLKNLLNQREELYIELEKTRHEFSIQKLEFMKRDRESQASQ